MPSNKETLFQDHICKYLEDNHQYKPIDKTDISNSEYHINENHLIQFIKDTQEEKYNQIAENFGTDTDKEIIKAVINELGKNKPLWLIIRNGVDVKGVKLELYKPKPRSKTSQNQQISYEKNILSFKKEYYYNPITKERIDIVIWLNGLPIIVIELKHEDEGQTCEDAIMESFLTRDLNNKLYKLPFLYVASSNVEVKVSTNPTSEKYFMWFNSALINIADTEGEYPVEHLYRDSLSLESITSYLERYLIFVPAVEKIDENGKLEKKDSFTIFPRYHQVRATTNLANDLKEHIDNTRTLGQKYLINHSAGAGKTLTISWMADYLDSLYTEDNKKVFDNIIILTDRKSLDKNIKDDLDNFTHLKNKINYTKNSSKLAEYLDKDKDIIVTIIDKFNHIEHKLENSSELKNRNIAFLIDEAHRSQDGKKSHTMKEFFTLDDTADELSSKDTSNQVFVAFTATTTEKTVAYFGEPFDIYSEEEAITEGYILDVASNIVSYDTLYHLRAKSSLPDKEFPTGVVSKALRNVAFEDDDLIQYKSEVIVKLFEEKVAGTIKGKGKAMVVASSRPAGLKYLRTIKTILKEKNLHYGVLYAFSDYTDNKTGEVVEEVKINELDTTHKGMLIEDVFDTDEYRILIVANKFQTGFNQPLLTAMFLDKAVNGVNAIQTVSRLNRKHIDKEQDEILVVDFTNNSKEIFSAFNKHRKGSPYQEEEPKVEVLEKLYKQILEYNIFTTEQIKEYVEKYFEAEQKARERESESDAELSNINQEYKKIFNTKLVSVDERKKYVSLLNRYIKLYYFIAQFFTLEEKLNEFVVFAGSIGQQFIQKGKKSELIEFVKNIELSKGAVKFVGNAENQNEPTRKPRSGGNSGGDREIPTNTLQQALDNIIEKFQISNEDAIIIKEICEEVAEQEDIKSKVIENKDNEIFLNRFEPNEIQQQIKNGYMARDMWDKLEDELYIGQGGIIPLMGKTVVGHIVAMVA